MKRICFLVSGDWLVQHGWAVIVSAVNEGFTVEEFYLGEGLSKVWKEAKGEDAQFVMRQIVIRRGLVDMILNNQPLPIFFRGADEKVRFTGGWSLPL